MPGSYRSRTLTIIVTSKVYISTYLDFGDIIVGISNGYVGDFVASDQHECS